MKKKAKAKIIILSIINIALAGALAFLIYIAFIADASFTKMGYSYSDITLIKKYQLEDKLTEYNQTVVYAINSVDFKEKNIDYYLLFNNQIDYTGIINELATKYSVADLKKLKSFISEDELIELVDEEPIKNIDNFKALLDLGYDFETSLTLIGSLDDEAVNAILTLPVLNNPDNFIKYVETGYSTETIVAIYNISEETFDQLSNIRYFEKLGDLIQVKGFKVSNLARYFWHMENYGSTVERAVSRVNINAEYVSQDSVNYTSYYTSNPTEAKMDGTEGLVNKSHVLSSDYTPENLVEVDPDYRGNNQLLVKEAAEAFVEMAKACEEAVDRRILAYSNYRSYAVEQSTYASYLINANNDDSVIAGFTSKAGYSEHQTGLAVDICQKGYSYTEMEECKSYEWLNEHCYEYGYIRRYPGNKAWITGYQGNAYHYRYVGKEVASIIHQYSWVYEEYYYLFCGD